ncbi:hypothetical protein NLU13_7410 [Sarocladium strictum]|uniref:Uncharacterized protein n=1 Tax=Sarocladium strictum TaxID=5046 RepID=A0AA39L562_SARSR|nr:hypothetical protein NLU13_7410 [Sarocladium strictum]
MASSEQFLIAFLRSDNIKDALLPHLDIQDLTSLRVSSSAFCNLLTKRLFTRITVTFSSSTFTRPCRVAALSRIGHHVEHLTFSFPHSEATFLPPLVHPLTGHEINFRYTPHTSMGSALTRPKYANSELQQILTDQYPPLFHAATNVPSFIHAMKMLPNMRHVTIRCPGQDPSERYRRDIVDYALISMRIALERAPLTNLSKLSLSSVHPGAFNYLRHVNGIGAVPSAGRRWKQIKKLHISVEAWDFYGSSPGLDHLKVIDDYIRTFSPSLEKFAFTWVGRKGPCPVALRADPLFSPPRSSRKLFAEVTSPMSPLPSPPCRAPMHFPRLRYLQIRNATMNAPQLKELISSHSKTVKEFDFENVVLLNNGNWEDALAPLDRDDSWSRSSLTAASECSFATISSAESLPSPSAAVAAASRELLDMDLGGFSFSDEDREVIEGLSADLMAAREASMSVTTKLKKKRRRRRRHRHEEEVTPPAAPPSPASSHRRKPSKPLLKSSFEILRPSTPTPLPSVAAPILDPDPHPILLQPTVYQPSSKHGASSGKADGISNVQRNLQQEESHRLMAEDPAARTSALQKAKEAVLSKLGREFGGGVRRHRVTAEAVAACRLMTSREFLGGGGGYCAADVVLEDRRGLETGSVMVPLMFARA